MDKSLMIEILMQDRCTKKEAEKHLKTGTEIFENPEEYIEILKANNCYYGETIEAIRNHDIADTSMVIYNGHEYLVVYAN